jgi:YesN/AraC family two-component response regulator
MIASELNFSTNYIREFFKQHEGTPLLEYIGAKRVELAKALLNGTNASIRDVCDRSGFINYSYFFTYFKKNTGLTPMEFKKNTLPHE